MFGSFCIFVIAVVSEMLRHIPLRNFVSGVFLDFGWRILKVSHAHPGEHHQQIGFPEAACWLAELQRSKVTINQLLWTMN